MHSLALCVKKGLGCLVMAHHVHDVLLPEQAVDDARLTQHDSVLHDLKEQA